MVTDSPVKNTIQSEEYYRKIRTIICELLSVWRMFASIENFIWNDKSTYYLAHKMPDLYKKYLLVNDERLKQVTDYYNHSLNGLKEIDVALFYSLENELFHFNRIINEILKPILQDKEIDYFHKNDFLKEMLRDYLNDIEKVIRETAAHLPTQETEKIIKIIDDHNNGLVNPKVEELPQWWLGTMNAVLPVQENINSIEFNNFIQSPAVAVALGKMIDSGLWELLYGKDIATYTSTLIEAKLQNDAYFNKIIYSPVFKEAINKIKFTIQEERELLIFKKDIYFLVMGFIQKANGYVPFKTKRVLVKLYRGEVSINNYWYVIFTTPIKI